MEEKTFYKRVEYNSIETNYNIPEKCVQQYENLNINKKLGEGSHGVVYNAHVNKSDKSLLSGSAINKSDKSLLSGSAINKSDKYVLKAVPLNVIIPSKYCDLKVKQGLLKCREVSDEEFDDEVKYSIIVSKANVGPKVYKSWKCDNVKSQAHLELFKMKEIKMGFILMEKMEYTLDTYYNNKKLVKKNDKILKEMYKDLITIMLKNNISHKDLPFENIMINIDKNKDPIKMRIIDWNSAKILNSEEDTIEGYLEHWDKVINVFYKQPYD